MNESEAVVSGWTNANLQKLLASMKDCIPEGEKTTSFFKGMKSLDWDKISFPPFSPEECKQKWTDIIEKMRKMRSITELIAEAEEVILDPLHNEKIHPEIPKRPVAPTSSYIMENYRKNKKYQEMDQKDIFKLLQKFNQLPHKKRMVYKEKYACEIKGYKQKLQAFSKNQMRAIQKQYDESEDDLPTKPPYNGYGVFCLDCKSSGETLKCGAMGLSLQWRSLSKSERAEYNKRWIELKEQYSEKLHKYLDRFNAKEQLQIIKDNNIKMHNVKLKNKAPVQEKRPSEPKMPSQVPYSYFFGEQVRLLKDEIPNLKARHAAIHKLWKNLPTKKQESYKSKVNVKLIKYAAELKNWSETLQPVEKLKYLKENPSKARYIDGITVCDGKEQRWHPTSDSEDEDMSVSDEEDISHNSMKEEEEEEEEEDIITFEID
ncbi:nucleolar transcription factor 1 [Nematolebias whitei]|uniref:nucleolar transcription factor 1 n=1 Tax=Nematolebias whitei TaxID=451745 RepID=UPI0018996317|nr:nucleolar transcription factor 1 [Nematolebias whitei]